MKAILILNNMPEDCFDCDFCQGGYLLSYLCGLTGEEFEFINGERKGFCPLKPMPKKLELKTEDEIDNYIKNLGYERVGNIHDTIGGYNACIDEIIGEEE